MISLYLIWLKNKEHFLYRRSPIQAKLGTDIKMLIITSELFA